MMKNNFIDVHCHILPGLDDGAKDIEQAKEMFMTAYEEGIRTIIATPHNYASRRSVSTQTIIDTCRQMKEYLAEWELPVSLYVGNEIYYRSGVAELLEEKKILSLADSRYVLVEFDPYAEFTYIRDGLGEIMGYGYFPILAHAERYDCLFQKSERIGELRNAGVYIQVNAASFLENWGSEFRKRSRELLKKERIDLIGTDAHSNRSRAPKMDKCAAYIYKKLGDTKAEKLLFSNPRAILENRRI